MTSKLSLEAIFSLSIDELRARVISSGMFHAFVFDMTVTSLSHFHATFISPYYTRTSANNSHLELNLPEQKAAELVSSYNSRPPTLTFANNSSNPVPSITFASPTQLQSSPPPNTPHPPDSISTPSQTQSPLETPPQPIAPASNPSQSSSYPHLTPTTSSKPTTSSINTQPLTTQEPQAPKKQPSEKKKPVRPGQDWSQLHRRRIALRFSYIGTDYAGFAYQKDEMDWQNAQSVLRPSTANQQDFAKGATPPPPSTVEGELLKALKIACLIPSYDLCNYTKCGRTDRGVHGLTQVVALDIKTRWKPQSSRTPIVDSQFPVNTHDLNDVIIQHPHDAGKPPEYTHSNPNYSLPGNFSCWCDIPGYIPQYATTNDYVKNSQAMMHSPSCRRLTRSRSPPSTQTPPPQTTAPSTQTISTFHPHKQSSLIHAPSTITANLSQIRQNPSLNIAIPQIRLLGCESELTFLYPALFEEIKDLPHQVAHYATKQQPLIDTYSTFEIDHFLNLRFRPWYDDMIAYHPWEEQLLVEQVDRFYHNFNNSSISSSDHVQDHPPSSPSINTLLTTHSSQMPPSILSLHPKSDPFFLAFLPFSDQPSNLPTFPDSTPQRTSTRTTSSEITSTSRRAPNSPSWLSNPLNTHLISQLTALYTKARNYNFNFAQAKQHDNLLFSSYLLNGFKPDETFNAQIATQHLPLLLHPLSLISHFHSSTPKNRNDEALFTAKNPISDSQTHTYPPSPIHTLTASTNTTLLSLTNTFSNYQIPQQLIHFPPLSSTIAQYVSSNTHCSAQTGENAPDHQIDHKAERKKCDCTLDTASVNQECAETCLTSPTTPHHALSIEGQQEMYHQLTNPTSRQYSQDTLLPLHPDQNWIDSQELDYIAMLNRLLPPTIRVIAWAPVPPSFTARFQCDGRAYKYFFYLDQMNICAMNRAAKKFIGKHDFRNVCTMDVVSIKSFIRTVSDIAVQPVENPDIVNYLLTQEAESAKRGQSNHPSAVSAGHNSLPIVSTQDFGGEYDSTLHGSRNQALKTRISSNPTNHLLDPFSTIAGLSPNVFNSNTYLALHSKQQNSSTTTTTHTSMSDSPFPHSNPSTPLQQTYIPCNNDPTNPSCRLCHVSTFSPPETLCETIIVGESFLYHQVRTMMGLLFMIGRGEETGDVISQLLDVVNNPRRPAFEFASDKGLILWECSFHNLPWKSTFHGVAKGLQQLHCLYRAMKLQTHMVETHWRAMLPNAVHLVHQYILKLLAPSHVMEIALKNETAENSSKPTMSDDVDCSSALTTSSVNDSRNQSKQKSNHNHEMVQLNEDVGFVALFLQQYNMYMTHHYQVQQYLLANPALAMKLEEQAEKAKQLQEKQKKTNNQSKSTQPHDRASSTLLPFSPLENKSITLYLDVYNTINAQLKQFNFTIHHFALICEWIYNLLNPQYPIHLPHSPHRDQTSPPSPPPAPPTNLSSELQLYKNLIYNANNSIPYYQATPNPTSNRVLSITPFPLSHISPTLPQYTHPMSTTLVMNVLRILSMSAFQFEILPTPTTNNTKTIYTILLFADYVHTQLLSAGQFDTPNSPAQSQPNILPLNPIASTSLNRIISHQQFAYPVVYNHVPLFQRPLEATLEEKLAKLNSVKKQRKERNLELDQVYG